MESCSEADIISGLPEIVTVRSSAGAPFSIFLSCDPIYFERFALPLIKSFRQHNQDIHLHIHLLDGDPAIWERLCSFAIEAAGPQVSVSAEKSNARYSDSRMGALYYAAARYIRFYQYLKAVMRPCWIMDVDATINRDPSWTFGNLAAFDVALWGCPHWLDPWTKVQASLFGATPTTAGLSYVRTVAAYIAHRWRQGALHWGSDQAALFCVYSYFTRNQKTPRTFFLDSSAVSPSNNPTSDIHFNSGAQKFRKGAALP